MAVVTMRQLLESGVHFGHQTRRWNPKMKRFIFTERNGIYIIDLRQTLDYIEKAERSLRVPVLAIHGTEDESVSIEQSMALEEANPELIDLLAIEGAGHVESFETDFDAYVAAVLEFLDNAS